MSVRGDDDTVAGTVAEPTGPTAATDVPALVAGRYQIVRWLGGGGMGRVYEAVDTELGERVALKMLRGGLSDDAIERFRREVRLTRRIQHRNVARMFDIGEHAGDRFLTMELVDGVPLTRELGGTMPWLRLASLAVQICEGLAAAHRVGVVHRDLKPDNILLERATDRAVITDFGIARSIDDAAVTQVGSVVGTPRYMAPEQLAGREVDARADIFSLGVVLYELATGTRPWSGDNAIAIAVAQATQPARTITSTLLPPGFIALLARCLALDPADRLGSVADVLAQLQSADAMAAPTTASAPRDRASRPTQATQTPAVGVPVTTSLAVLPLTCAPGDEYLADGVHEDLVDSLSMTASLRVRPAGIVRSACDAADPRQLGRELGVDHVVVGTLRRVPAGVRVSVRLIGVADGFQIFAHRVDCAEAEVLAASAKLGDEIASALSTRAASATRPTDPRAVDLYLRARGELRRFWGNHAQAAADLLDQAYALSPTAPIAGARAFASVQAWVLQSDPTLRDRAQRALDDGLATGHAEALLASASFRLNTGDPIGAATDLGTALVRAPMLGQAHEITGRILVEVGALDEARHHMETACALDPHRAPIISMDLARLDALEGWWERADRRIAALLADPDRSLQQLASVFHARLAGWRGRRDEAFAAADAFAPRMGNVAGNLASFLAMIAKQGGKIDEGVWQQFSARFTGTERPHRGQLMGMQMLMEMALTLDQPAIALRILEQANALQFLDVVALDKCPLFDTVARDATFVQLRAAVAARAAQLLATFRAATGATAR